MEVGIDSSKPGLGSSTGEQAPGTGCGVCARARARSIAQSCPTLCDHVDCSPPGSSVRGILQATLLEWAAISSSRASSLSEKITPLLFLRVSWIYVSDFFSFLYDVS